MDSIPWGEFTNLIYWSAERSIIVSLAAAKDFNLLRTFVKITTTEKPKFGKFTCIETLRQTLKYNAPSLREKDDCVR